MSEDSIAEAVRKVVKGGPAVIRQVRRKIKTMLDAHARAASLFLDGDGELKPDAREWFAVLARDNYVDGGTFHMDPREHARREGRRELALEIIRSADLDVGRLASLTRLEREIE